MNGWAPSSLTTSVHGTFQPISKSGFSASFVLDDATSDQDPRVPPSNHFEKLHGRLKGLYSIRINR
jgi:toxin HigB-1